MRNCIVGQITPDMLKHMRLVRITNFFGLLTLVGAVFVSKICSGGQGFELRGDRCSFGSLALQYDTKGSWMK
jgi:hypothetical protein